MLNSQDQIINAANYYRALLSPQLTQSETVAGCLAAKSSAITGIFVKPCYVRQAVNSLRRSDIMIGTVIGYPHGGKSKYALIAETKRALTEGAQMLLLSIHPGYLIEGNFTDLNAEIQSICGLAHMNGAQAFSLIDPEHLSETHIASFRDNKINDTIDGIFVVTSSERGIGETVPIIAKLAEGLSTLTKIGILCDRFTLDEQVAYINAGCSSFISEKVSSKTCD